MTELGQSPPSMHSPLPATVGRSWIDRLSRAESPAFTQRRARRAEQSGTADDPIVWREACGANVVDVDGNVYVDFTSGFGVAAIGHRHPAVVAAIARQSKQLLHALGDLHPSEPKVMLLERLVALAPWDDARAVLSLNGADAVTTALKTAMLATKKPGVLAFHGGYHGLCYGPLAASSFAPHFREPFIAQLNPHVTFSRWPNRQTTVDEALAALPRDWSDIGAVLVEPIQGRGGVRVPPAGFLSALRERVTREGALLIADEIFTGLGRCGSWWRSADDRALPDLLCTGKALGGGLPVSACLGSSEVMEVWGAPGNKAIHTGTFFGNPLSAASAIAVLDVLEQTDIMAKGAARGETLRLALANADLPYVSEVRGAGLLIGVELDNGRRTLRVVRGLLERGYLALLAGDDGRVLQLCPPLSIDEALLHDFVETLSEVLRGEQP